MSDAVGPLRDDDVKGMLENGVCRFCGLEFLVEKGVIVPRHETELLCERAVEIAKGLATSSEAAIVVDMCCGAGNLGCVVAARVPSCRVFSCDVSPAATDLSLRNAQRLGLGSRLEVGLGDLFAALPPELRGRVDVVVCNPPYISTNRLETERAFLLEEEPREAFDGGPYGLSLHQRVIRESLDWLRPGGWLLFEFGLGQNRQLELLFQRAKAFRPVVFLNGSLGEPRVAVAERMA